MKNDSLDYYVYLAFYRGILVYVGKGTGKRWKHLIKGQSGSELINDFYFRNKYLNDFHLSTHIYGRYKTEKEALKFEKLLIEKYKPYCNKCSGREHETIPNEISEKLSAICEKLGYSQPENLYSKFDYRFLFTPKGLLCQSVKLADSSPFEYTEEDYHIRIKPVFHKFFQEYGLQFLKYSDGVDGEFLAFSTTRGFFRHLTLIGRNLFEENGFDIGWSRDAFFNKSFNYYSHFKLDCTNLGRRKKEDCSHDYLLNESYYATNQVGHVIEYILQGGESNI